MLRKKVTRRSRSIENGENNETASPHETHPLISDTPAANPWADADGGLSSDVHGYSHHRLSYDPASGVIMLPEGDDWLMDDDDSSDEYGNATPPSGEAASTTLQEDLGHTSSSPSAPASPKRRYGTYYHHPERRKVARSL